MEQEFVVQVASPNGISYLNVEDGIGFMLPDDSSVRAREEHTELIWRTKIYQELCVMADGLAVKIDNQSLGIAIAEIIREYGKKISKIPSN
jgi:hypothetical protein